MKPMARKVPIMTGHGPLWVLARNAETMVKMNTGRMTSTETKAVSRTQQVLLWPTIIVTKSSLKCRGYL